MEVLSLGTAVGVESTCGCLCVELATAELSLAMAVSVESGCGCLCVESSYG